MGNEALQTNAGVFEHADLEITTHGSDWYYAVCALMGTCAIAVLGLSFAKPRTHRLFHHISAGILAIAAIAYFSMGSNLGQVPIRAEFMRHSSSKVSAAGSREIFYARCVTSSSVSFSADKGRYIDWFLTTPLLLLDLLLTAGLPWPTILAALLADEIMIVCGLIGALVPTRYKWGYWTFGMCALFYVVFVLVIEGRRHANLLGGSIKRTYNMCGVLMIGLWFLYPIAWGVSEGANIIHPDSEAVYYGVLDILAKPVFTLMLLYGHRTIDPCDLGLNIRHASKPAPAAMEQVPHHSHMSVNNAQT